MSDYLGSRISLISKSDIRYVGTLVEINSENHTVALENVMSYGTEGRRTGEEEYPPSSSLYEYILFRGSDVKDLRIEEPPKETVKQPAMPNDPAILGSSRPPRPASGQPQTQAAPPQNQQQTPLPQQPSRSNQPGPNAPAQQQPFGQYGPYGAPMMNQGFGRGAFPSGPGYMGYNNMPYGAPPQWYPPPGQGMPPGPGGFPPQGPQGPQVPIGPGQQGPPPQQQGKHQGPVPGQTAPIEKPADKKAEAKVQDVGSSKVPAAATSDAKAAPPPPIESKPDVAAALAPAQPQPKPSVPTGPKGRVVPAMPLTSTAQKHAQKPAPAVTPKTATSLPTEPAIPKATQQKTPTTGTSQNSAAAAAAAVAAAMAKLPMASKAGQDATGTGPAVPASSSASANLARKMQQMSMNAPTSRATPGTTAVRGGGPMLHRGGSGFRGGRGSRHQAAKVEIPTTDYDFESANAKFKKENEAKEIEKPTTVREDGTNGTTPGADAADIDPATPGGLSSSAAAATEEDVVIPPPPSEGTGPVAYNRKTSFFDNISSEITDRGTRKPGSGAEFRSEERKRNMETFGQGSVDSGYRGGYRGRGGRGRFMGRGGWRGGRGRGGRGRGEGVVES